MQQPVSNNGQASPAKVPSVAGTGAHFGLAQRRKDATATADRALVERTQRWLKENPHLTNAELRERVRLLHEGELPPYIGDQDQTPPPADDDEPARYCDELEKPKPSAQPRAFTNLVVKATNAMPEIQWLVQDMLSLGGTSLLVGDAKIGKTRLAQYLAAQVCDGREFLGRKTASAPVLFLALEGSESGIISQFMKLAPDNAKQNLFVRTSADGSLSLQELVEEIRWHGACLVVIDTLQRFADIKDANDYAIVTRALEPLVRMAVTENIHLCLLHHTNKGGGFMGSQAFKAMVDTMFTFTKRDGVLTLSAVQRNADELPPTMLALNEDTGRFVFGGDVWRAQNEVNAQHIERLLRETPGLCRDDIFTVIGARYRLHPKMVRFVFDRMKHEGKLRWNHEGKPRYPALYAMKDDDRPIPDDGYAAKKAKQVSLLDSPGENQENVLVVTLKGNETA
jgi:hypothetical protein